MLFRSSFETFMRYNQVPKDTDMSREQIENMKHIPIQLDYLAVDDIEITHTRKVVSFQKKEPGETFGIALFLSFADDPRAAWNVHLDVDQSFIQEKLDHMTGKTLGGFAGLGKGGTVFYTSAGNPLFYRVLKEKLGYKTVAGQTLENSKKWPNRILRSVS